MLSAIVNTIWKTNQLKAHSTATATHGSNYLIRRTCVTSFSCFDDRSRESEDSALLSLVLAVALVCLSIAQQSILRITTVAHHICRHESLRTKASVAPLQQPPQLTTYMRHHPATPASQFSPVSLLLHSSSFPHPPNLSYSPLLFHLYRCHYNRSILRRSYRFPCCRIAEQQRRCIVSDT